jgi:hypothetical protein
MTSILAAAGGVTASPLRWYAVADPAQRKELPGVIAAESESRCLFDAPEGSPLAASAPHLVSIPPPSKGDNAWVWIDRNASSAPCVTVIASPLQFGQLFAHLRSFTEVVLPDGEDMFFAFWDPAILGTLVGQIADKTLHVPGPVLSLTQRDALLQGIWAWWYWDRDGALQQIGGSANERTDGALPLQLTQSQMDMLVEASVPDHLLHFVELNQSHLFESVPAPNRYRVVRAGLEHAREFGLVGMSDLVNFVCISLIYGDAMRTDPKIIELLEKLRNGVLTWEQTMDALP